MTRTPFDLHASREIPTEEERYRRYDRRRRFWTVTIAAVIAIFFHWVCTH